MSSEYEKLAKSWLDSIGVQTNENRDVADTLNRVTVPSRVHAGDFFGLPEFQVVKMLAPNARFDEAAYREGLWRHSDDSTWAVIFAYNLPRTQSMYDEIKQLSRLYGSNQRYGY